MDDLIPEDDGRGPSATELAEAQFAIRPELNGQLVDVIRELADIADRDCYGSDRDGECDCETCTAKRVIAKLNRIRLPVVRSLQPGRLNYAEAVYFDAWVKQNTRVRCVNGGYGTLELILSGDTNEYGYTRPAYVSQRDMDVATAVIQWLGTNCGGAFLRSCEREAEARQAERRNYEGVSSVATWSDYREKPLYSRVGDRIAETFFPGDEAKRMRLSKEIARAMFYAKAKAELDVLAGGED